MTPSYVFIRHAKAASGDQDKFRPLAEKGHQQAIERGESLKAGGPFQLAISSSATRAHETAQDILNAMNIQPELVLLDEIYEAQEAIDRNEVAHLMATFGDDMQGLSGHDDKGAWSRYVTLAKEAIDKVIEARSPTRVLIVGHLNVINSLGSLYAPETRELTRLRFGTSEGFELKGDELILYCKN